MFTQQGRRSGAEPSPTSEKTQVAEKKQERSTDPATSRFCHSLQKSPCGSRLPAKARRQLRMRSLLPLFTYGHHSLQRFRPKCQSTGLSPLHVQQASPILPCLFTRPKFSFSFTLPPMMMAFPRTILREEDTAMDTILKITWL